MSKPVFIPPLYLALFGLFMVMINMTYKAPWILRFDLAPQSVIETDFVGGDFRVFWAQGRLAANGTPELAYDATAVYKTGMMEKLPGVIDVRPSFYPPHFLMMMEPLGKLDYARAWQVYNWASVAALALVSLLAFGRHVYVLPILAGFGGLWSALMFGQNSMALTVIYLVVAVWGVRHERLGGLVLSVATFKPHFGVLMPLVLLWRQQYRTIVWAILGTVLLTGASALHLGAELWQTYFSVLHEPVDRLVGFNNVKAEFMVSLYSSLRGLGVSPVVALGAQAVLALGAIQMLWRICRRALDPMLPIAAAVTASLLVSPHVYSYDMVLLFVPLMALLLRVQKQGWRWADLEAFLPAYILPFYISTLNHYTGLPFMPLAMLLLLYRLKQYSRMDHD